MSRPNKKKYNQRLYQERYRVKNPWFQSQSSAKSRCSVNQKYWKKGICYLLTLEDIKFLWIRDNANSLRRPSIDRIDPSGNYTLENTRFIELSENVRRGKIGKPAHNCKEVFKFDLNKNFICVYPSLRVAATENKISEESIGDCARGRYRKSHGFIWKYQKENTYENN